MDDFDIDEIFDRSHQGNHNWLLPAFDQQDAIYLSSSRSMLEPIMEETSEDEESSSHDYNHYENGAWSSESETGSVIRIELTNDQDSISERGIACPPKRARRDLDLNLSLLNSNSLLPPLPVSSSSLSSNSLLSTTTNNNTTTNNPTNLHSFNTNISQLSTNNTNQLSSCSSSLTNTNLSNHNLSYTINGLIDSPQNLRKFRNSNDTSSGITSSLLDSPIAEIPMFQRKQRFDDFNIYSDSDSLSYNSLSRSSSLIQFESLERQLQNDLSSSSIGSSPSLLSFDANGTDLCNSNSNSNISQRGSCGSLKRFIETSDSRIHQTYYDLDKIDFDKNTPSILFRTSRALSEERQSKSDSESSSDNSILSHEERILVRPTGSLNPTPTHSANSSTRRNSTSSRTKSSVENLSEDSGYCEHYQPLKTKSKSIPSFEKFCEEDEFENHKSMENIRCYNPQLPQSQSRRSSNSSTSDDDDTKSDIKNNNNAILNNSNKDKIKFTSILSSPSSSDEDYYMRSSKVITQHNKNQQQQSVPNTNTTATSANKHLYNQNKQRDDGINTLALLKENTQLKYACSKNTDHDDHSTYSANLKSTIPSKSFKSTEAPSFDSKSMQNSYFPTNSSSLPDVRGEFNSNNGTCSDINVVDINRINNNNNNNNNNNKNRHQFDLCEEIYLNKNFNKQQQNKKQKNLIGSESIATQNKIFRIDCISPDPELNDDFDEIIIFGGSSSKRDSLKSEKKRNSFLLNAEKCLSSDHIEKCDSFINGNENSLLDDKYLTERSSVPKDLNLLANDTYTTSTPKRKSNNNNIHNTTINSTAIIVTPSSPSKQFYLHQSSSGYESFINNSSQDSNCYNSTYSDSDNFDTTSSSCWNDTTIIKRGNISANEKREKFANSSITTPAVILRNKNKNRLSGEFDYFTNNSNSSLNSGYMNASYQDLTRLDYSGSKNSIMDNSNKKRNSKEILFNKRSSLNGSSDNEISKGNYLLDEISENFNKQLSIISDKTEDFDHLKEFMNSEKLSSTVIEEEEVEKPIPSIRPSKLKENEELLPQQESRSQPIKKPPRKHLKPTQHKQLKTFDIDPSIMKTSYAESLERCNFDPKELSTQDIIETIERSRSPIQHSTPIKQYGFMASAPNLHSFKVEKVIDDFDDMRISSASNSMQRLPHIVDKKLGILVPSGSKQSLGKSVNFCPVVAEYSWRERSNSSTIEPDSLEDVNDDPILLANTVANEIFVDEIDCAVIKEGSSNKNNNKINENNKKVLRETNFEWNGELEESNNKNKQKPPQKLIATIINNKTSLGIAVATATPHPTSNDHTVAANNDHAVAASNNDHAAAVINEENISKNKFSNKTNANEARYNESGVNNKINGNGTVNNNKSEINKSSNNNKIDKNNLKEEINKNKNPKMGKMEPSDVVLKNVIVNTNVKNGNIDNIDKNVKNITEELIKSETKIKNNNNYKNGTTNINNDNNNKSKTITTVTITKTITPPSTPLSSSSTMKTTRTYSSANNSPNSNKPQYSQSQHLNTTVPLNPANSNEYLNKTFKKENRSFLSRFTGGLRFSLRRKPKKTLPNEPMPTSVTEQQQTLAKNHRNIFGYKKKSIADGAIKSKQTQNGATKVSSSSGEQLNNRDSRGSPDFIYIPLKRPIPSVQLNGTHHEDEQSGNIKQQNGRNSVNDNNNHMLNQVTGKPPLPKQPPRVIQTGSSQYDGNEDKILSMQFDNTNNNNNNKQRAGSMNAHNNGEFNHLREKRSQSQPKEIESGDTEILLGKFLDNERYFYSDNYQFDENTHGNGTSGSNKNSNKMNKYGNSDGSGGGGHGNAGYKMQNGHNKINKNKINNYNNNNGDDYIPPPTQFTDEKPPSGKIRKSSGSSASGVTGAGINSGGNNKNNKIGLIETNLDTHETVISGKTQSLMELGPNNSTRNYHKNQMNIVLRQNDNMNDDDDIDDDNVNGSNHHTHHQKNSIRRPHKSMEFLLDKENQKDVMPPENELQKSHDSTAALSEHQLRVQASLQRLNIPDWYRAYSDKTGKTGDQHNNSQSNSGGGYKPGSFTRKRASDSGRWVGLNSKTTSLSSLGSQRSDRSPLLLSPSAHSHHGTTTGGCATAGSVPVSGGFSRWSTSYLNSTQTSPSVSQRGSFSRGGPINSSFSSTGAAGGGCGSNNSSIRNSFRQPYMGWRSQEKINQPRTPHERLASSILATKPPKTETVNVTPEIQSSIKEVTSAIVHHFNDQTRQPTNINRSRSTSPNSRKCWLESSFVGVRPLESPQTPTIETNTLTISTQHQQQQHNLPSTSDGSGIISTSIPVPALIDQQQQQYQQQLIKQLQQQHQQQHQQQQQSTYDPVSTFRTHTNDPVSTFRTHTNTPQRSYQQQPQQYQQQYQQSEIIRVNGVGESTII